MVRGKIGEAERAVARRLYETTFTPMVAIGRELGVTAPTIARLVRRGGWRRRAAARPSPDGGGTICPGIGLCPVRADVQRRLHVQLLARIEAAGTAAPAPAERERDIRALGGLTRTLEKLMAMDRDTAAAAAEGHKEETAPDDLDALREALSQRLERLVSRRRGG